MITDCPMVGREYKRQKTERNHRRPITSLNAERWALGAGRWTRTVRYPQSNLKPITINSIANYSINTGARCRFCSPKAYFTSAAQGLRLGGAMRAKMDS